MRLTKETAKDRIEVVAVPVGNSIEKTVHKPFFLVSNNFECRKFDLSYLCLNS